MQAITRYFSEDKVKRIPVFCGILFCILIFLICWLSFGSALTDFFKDKALFSQWMLKFGNGAAVIFVLIRAVQTVVKIIPAEPLEIGAGYLFGTFGGMGLCMLGTLLGSLVIILLTKTLGKKITDILVPEGTFEKYPKLYETMSDKSLLFLLYLIPGTPKDLFTYAYALEEKQIGLFLLITGIARIPSILTSTWCGGTLENGNIKAAALIFIITGITGIIAGLFYKKRHTRN